MHVCIHNKKNTSFAMSIILVYFVTTFFFLAAHPSGYALLSAPHEFVGVGSTVQDKIGGRGRAEIGP